MYKTVLIKASNSPAKLHNLFLTRMDKAFPLLDQSHQLKYIHGYFSPHTVLLCLGAMYTHLKAFSHDNYLLSGPHNQKEHSTGVTITKSCWPGVASMLCQNAHAHRQMRGGMGYSPNSCLLAICNIIPVISQVVSAFIQLLVNNNCRK